MQQAATFAELVATPYRDLGVLRQRALTDHGPEYVGQDFRDRLAGLGIEHTRIKPLVQLPPDAFRRSAAGLDPSRGFHPRC